jgi:hypothetical protein
LMPEPSPTLSSPCSHIPQRAKVSHEQAAQVGAARSVSRSRRTAPMRPSSGTARLKGAQSGRRRASTCGTRAYEAVMSPKICLTLAVDPRLSRRRAMRRSTAIVSIGLVTVGLGLSGHIPVTVSPRAPPPSVRRPVVVPAQPEAIGKDLATPHRLPRATPMRRRWRHCRANSRTPSSGKRTF